MDDPASSYFNCSDSERAAFEAGIKLGSVYHQFMGTPLSHQNADVLERAIEEGVRVQPFVEDVRVHIDRSYLKERRSPYRYISLTGNMLQVELKVRYATAVVVCGMKFFQDLRYPLMYVKEVRPVKTRGSSEAV
ncbi:MAG: dihydroneopterin aldolase family protein [Candidatus Thermoplasmatota archaeon]|nr:dihydroneopterin aldolase family protein [Candidatus Thermoplasmatota archaeon]